MGHKMIPIPIILLVWMQQRINPLKICKPCFRKSGSVCLRMKIVIVVTKHRSIQIVKCVLYWIAFLSFRCTLFIKPILMVGIVLA